MTETTIHMRALLGCACLSFAAAAQAQTPGAVPDAPLTLAGRTELAGYHGDFDHFGVDLVGQRLFLAGEDQGTLEVFDLHDGRHLQTVKGFGAPHAIRNLTSSNRLLITDSGRGMSKLLDGADFHVVKTIALVPGADSMGYDPSTSHAWIVTGGKNAEPKLARTVLFEVDAASGRPLGRVSFDSDFTEAMVAEQRGTRLFVNIAGRSEVAVLDKHSRRRLATWPVAPFKNNSAMALDEAGRRLFVITRKPFMLLVLDTDSGRVVAQLDAPQRTNDLAYDAQRRRLYLAGDDHVFVIAQRDPDHYELVAQVPSAHGAKTAVLVPQADALYVAVAGQGDTLAALLRYALAPASRAAQP
jgi:hypothetical protein